MKVMACPNDASLPAPDPCPHTSCPYNTKNDSYNEGCLLRLIGGVASPQERAKVLQVEGLVTPKRMASEFRLFGETMRDYYEAKSSQMEPGKSSPACPSCGVPGPPCRSKSVCSERKEAIENVLELTSGLTAYQIWCAVIDKRATFLRDHATNLSMLVPNQTVKQQPKGK